MFRFSTGGAAFVPAPEHRAFVLAETFQLSLQKPGFPAWHHVCLGKENRLRNATVIAGSFEPNRTWIKMKTNKPLNSGPFFFGGGKNIAPGPPALRVPPPPPPPT